MRRHLLLADALAWPLRSPEGLARGADRLDPAWLRVGFAAHVQRHGPDASAADVGESVWGPGGLTTAALGDRPRLVEYLKWLADALLWRDGDEARLRELRADWLRHDAAHDAHPVVGEPGEELLLWRALSLQLPPALLLAAMPGAQHNPPRRVCLLPPQLRFERRTAHLHGHYGQATGSDEAWARLPAQLGALLKQAREAHARRERVGCLVPQVDATATLSEDGLLLRARLFERRLVHHMNAHPGGIGECEACAAPETAWLDLVIELVEARSGLAAPASQQLREHEGLRLLTAEEPLPGAPRGDLAAQAETPALLTCALRQILRTDEEDPTVRRAVAQLLRARALLHARLVMDPARPGLRSFRAGPEQAGGAHVPLPHARQVQLHMGARHLDVQATELRSAPTQPEAQLGQAIAARDKQTAGGPEGGWVPHLSRTVKAVAEAHLDDDGPSTDEGSGDRGPDAHPQAEDQARPRAEARRAAAQRALWSHGEKAVAQVDALIAAVSAAHDRGDRPLRALRGFDLAGEERSGPLWLMRPALARLRAALEPFASDEGLPAPGLTLHCGEDFAHLLSGLRAVHEPLRCGLWRQGDRLGHALALGVEPARWARDRPTVPMRALDRALDLIWARETAGRLCVALSGDELLRIDQELDALAGCLGLAQPDAHAAGAPNAGVQAIRALDQALWCLTASDLRGLAGKGSQDPSLDRPDLQPLHALIAAGALTHSRWIEVPTAPDLPLLDRLSAALARELADRQALIELCPSSNLLVGALHAPLGQERLWTRGLSAGDLRALPLCLSADDPMAFCTTLEDEVAYAWAGMVVAGGLPAAWARGWIDEALGAAWRGRFTLPAGV